MEIGLSVKVKLSIGMRDFKYAHIYFMIEFAKRKSYQFYAVTHDENFSLQSFVKDDWKLFKGMEKADKIVLTEYKNLLTNLDKCFALEIFQRLLRE